MLDSSFTKHFKIELLKQGELIKWKEYNLFSWDCSIVDEFKNLIKDACKNLNFTFLEDLWINGWVYHASSGDSIRLHNHSVHNNSFLSGTLCLTTCDVVTEFHIPILSMNPECGPLTLSSKEGRLILFPSCIPHCVSELKKGTRFSVGFDLITNTAMEYFKENSNSPSDPLYRAIPYGRL